MRKIEISQFYLWIDSFVFSLSSLGVLGVLAVVGFSLGSSTALFAQTGPALESPLPEPRRLPAGAPVEAAASPRPPVAAPVEEPAPAPREVTNPTDMLPPNPPGEESAPMPREQTPGPPPLLLPSVSRAAPPIEAQRLHQEIEGLRTECEAMLLEEMELISAKEVKAGKGDEVAQIRRRVTELLLRAAQQNKKSAPSETQAKPDPAQTSPASPKPPPRSEGEGSKSELTPPKPLPQSEQKGSKRPSSPRKREKETKGEGDKPPSKPPDHPSKLLTDAPVDPLSLAQSLFLAGDHEAALNAYRQLEQGEQKPDERIAIQYMIACCLRKLGKLDEATALYREVANSGGNDILVENAQWYLRAIKNRRELEGQLDELRQRRQTLMPRKP